MARTWLSVSVELLGGRGDELWPWPGRIFAVGPSHTFLDLANAINTAFARWDIAHLSVFTLEDGRVVTDIETGEELTASTLDGPMTLPLDIAKTKVARTLDHGAEFQFTFDLGDNWTHRCFVENEKVDPVDVLGIRPDKPLAYWGWGDMPDQYGRRWISDDGSSDVPPRPSKPHPMLTHRWPEHGDLLALDVVAVRSAIASRDAAGFMDAVTGRDIDDVLQLVGEGVAMALAEHRKTGEAIAFTVVNRLTFRDGPGDRVLADDLISRVRGEPLPGQPVPVDLDYLVACLEMDPDISTGAYVDLRTGDVHLESATDAAVVGDDAVIDVESEPDNWLWLRRVDARDDWQDMAAFAERQSDTSLRSRIEQTIEGRGAFARFHDLVRREGLSEQWDAFANDRQTGRARELLAERGIRVR